MLTQFFRSESVILNLSKDKFKAFLVSMVVKDVLPLHFFRKSEGFMGMLGDAAARLEGDIFSFLFHYMTLT